MLAVGSVAVLGAGIATSPAILVEPARAGDLAAGEGIRLALGCVGLAALGGVLLRLRLPIGFVPWILVATVVSTPLLLPDPVPARSLAAVAAALLSAAWLLDHPPGRTA